MSDVSGAAAPSAPVTSAANESGPTSVYEIARELGERRRKAAEQRAAPVAEKVTEAAPDPESIPQGSDVDPPTEAPGETTKTTETAEPAPIQPPQSWTKAEKEEFATYPREAQEKIARREQERDAAIRRSQNDAAEKLKGLTAKEQAVEQARQHYEAGLATLQQTLQSQIAGAFADIRTMADVQKMAVEDPFRYSQWDAAQKQLAVVAEEKRLADQRQAAEAQKKQQEFIAEQDKSFYERHPDFKDDKTAAKFMKTAASLLEDVGFTTEEMHKSWNGDRSLSLRDHRLQSILVDAARYRLGQEALKAPQPKPVPQVQQPGVARPHGAADSERIQALSNRLSKTGDAKDAIALLAAQRAARSR